MHASPIARNFFSSNFHLPGPLNLLPPPFLFFVFVLGGLCTLCLLICQVRVTIGDSGLLLFSSFFFLLIFVVDPPPPPPLSLYIYITENFYIIFLYIKPSSRHCFSVLTLLNQKHRPIRSHGSLYATLPLETHPLLLGKLKNCNCSQDCRGREHFIVMFVSLVVGSMG